LTISGLFGLHPPIEVARDVILLRARGSIEKMMPALDQIAARSPWRHMTVPGGKRMSVANTNCGDLGWISDARGYRYSATDPLTGLRWPEMPKAWRTLADRWAVEAGFEQGLPADACLINAYATGAKMSAHQDRDESDMQWPIVSLSLGASARFVMGGPTRSDKASAIMLMSGDVLVWGRSARLNYHGVGVPRKTAETSQPKVTLPYPRLNFTFRRAALP